jgi:Na+-transporting NADH:ubiquinone oxidoreductase subunit NqrC
MSGKNSTMGLKLDAYPNDAKRHTREATDVSESLEDESNTWIIALAVIIIVVLILIAVQFVAMKKRQIHQKEPDGDHLIINQVMREALKTQEIETIESNTELKSILDAKLENKEISEETYDYILNNVLIPEEPDLLSANDKNK